MMNKWLLEGIIDNWNFGVFMRKNFSGLGNEEMESNSKDGNLDWEWRILAMGFEEFLIVSVSLLRKDFGLAENFWCDWDFLRKGEWTFLYGSITFYFCIYLKCAKIWFVEL